MRSRPHVLVLQGAAPRPLKFYSFFSFFSVLGLFWRKWQETIFIFSPQFSFKINLIFSDRITGRKSAPIDRSVNSDRSHSFCLSITKQRWPFEIFIRSWTSCFLTTITKFPLTCTVSVLLYQTSVLGLVWSNARPHLT